MRIFFFMLCVLIMIPFTMNGQMKAKADLIVTNAVVYTADDKTAKAEAIAIRDGKILETGTNRTVSGKYESRQTLDAVGKAVFPGFIDAHSHFLGYALSLQMADLTTCLSFEEVLETMKKHSGEISSGWLTGRGWDQNKWPDKLFPDRALLDKKFPDRPVVLIRIDGHGLLANGEALRRVGIGLKNNFKPGEVEVKEGRLTGMLFETAADKMREAIPDPEDEVMADLVKMAQQNCLSAGLVSVADAGLETDQISFLDSLQRDGTLKIHLYVMLTPTRENLSRFLSRGPFLSKGMTIRSIKLYADGSLGSRTALLKQPYADMPGARGILVSDPDSIRELCTLARDHGFQVNTHAIGDSAVKQVLDIYGEFLRGNNDLRWRIEHCQVVDPADLQLFGKYSVVPSVQATHATSDMYWAGDRLGHDRLRGAYAYKDLLVQNGWIANGTDFPIENINPVMTFYAAVARKDLKGYPEKGFQPENAISRDEALKSITIWAAKAGFEETRMGSLEPGKRADFVILDKDIMTVPEKDIPQAKVQALYIRGKKVYEK